MVRAGYENNAFYLVFDYASPTKEELKITDPTTPLEIRYKTVDNILFFIARADGLPEIDAPFAPMYHSNTFAIAPVPKNMGYMLNVIMRDTTTGKIVGQRIIGLGHNFSTDIYNTILKLLKIPFNVDKYNRTLQKVYSRYTTRQLWDTADAAYIVGTLENEQPIIKKSEESILLDLIKERGEYVPGFGICVYCVLECHRKEAKGNEKEFEVPIPIGYLDDKGFKFENNIVYVDAPYDENFGVKIDEKYYDE